jgi:hypothetical protein
MFLRSYDSWKQTEPADADGPLEFCEECEMWPCVCAEIESGQRCPKCRRINEAGPGPHLFCTCGDCYGGRDE